MKQRDFEALGVGSVGGGGERVRGSLCIRSRYVASFLSLLLFSLFFL